MLHAGVSGTITVHFFLRCYLPLSPEWSTKECNLLFIFTFTCTNIYFTPKAQAYYVIIYSFFFSHNKFKMHTIYLIIHKGVLLGRRCIFLLWGKYITSVPCGWKLQYVGRSLDRVDFCLVIQVRNNINFHKKENCGCKVYIVKIIIINIINKIQI